MEGWLAVPLIYQMRGAGNGDGAIIPDTLHSESVLTRPLFVIKMVVEGDGFKFAPSHPAMIKAVLGIIDHFVAMLNTVPRIEGEIGKGGGGARLMTVATPDDEMICNAKARVQAILEANLETTNFLMKTYNPFTYLLSSETDKKVEDFIKARHQLPEVTSEISKYEKARKEVDKRSIPEVNLNLMQVHVSGVKLKLSSRAEEVATRLRANIQQLFIAKGNDLCSRYQEIFLRLGMHPNTEEEMVELETFLQESSGMLMTLNSELNEARKALRFLTEQSVELSEEELKTVGETWCWPNKIKPKVVECNNRLKAERNRAEDELSDKRDAFIAELDDYVVQAEAFSSRGEIERLNENMAALNALVAKLKEGKERAAGINGEEELLGQPRTQFLQLTSAPDILAPYLDLWTTAQNFHKNHHSWLNGAMKGVDPEVVESEVKAMYKANFKAIKNLDRKSVV